MSVAAGVANSLKLAFKPLDVPAFEDLLAKLDESNQTAAEVIAKTDQLDPQLIHVTRRRFQQAVQSAV